MPDSIREIVLAGMKTKLDELLSAPQLFAMVRRNWPGRAAPSQTPAALMFDGGEEVRDLNSCQVQIDIPVEVDLVCRAAESDNMGPEFSARLAEVKALFMADETLGGTVTRVRYGGCTDPVLDEEMGGSPLIISTLTFDVLYEHKETDPYSL